MSEYRILQCAVVYSNWWGGVGSLEGRGGFWNVDHHTIRGKTLMCSVSWPRFLAFLALSHFLSLPSALE